MNVANRMMMNFNLLGVYMHDVNKWILVALGFDVSYNGVQYRRVNSNDSVLAIYCTAGGEKT
jgi:hypothetical protein